MSRVQRVFYVGVSPTPIDPQTGQSGHWVKFTGATGNAPNFPTDGLYTVTEAGHPDQGVSYLVRVAGMYGENGQLFEFQEPFEGSGYARIYAPRESELGLGVLGIFDNTTSPNTNFEEAVLAAGPEHFFRVNETSGTGLTNIAPGATENLVYGQDISNYSVGSNTGSGANIDGIASRNIYFSQPVTANFGGIYYREDSLVVGDNFFLHGIPNLTQSDYLSMVFPWTDNTHNLRFYDTVYGSDFFEYLEVDALSSTITQTNNASSNLHDYTDSQFTVEREAFGTDVDQGDTSVWTFKVDPDYFNIVQWAGTGALQDIPHGLNSAPVMFFVFRRNTSTTGSLTLWLDGFLIDSTYITLNPTTSTLQFQNGDLLAGSPGVTNIPLGTASAWNSSNRTDPDSFTAYIFASDGVNVQEGEYQGNNTTVTVDCGFAPGLVFLKQINNDDVPVCIHDKYRQADVGDDVYFNPHIAGASENTLSTGTVTFTGTGFTVNTTDATHNALLTYRWVAFRDPLV